MQYLEATLKETPHQLLNLLMGIRWQLKISGGMKSHVGEAPLNLLMKVLAYLIIVLS